MENKLPIEYKEPTAMQRFERRIQQSIVSIIVNGIGTKKLTKKIRSGLIKFFLERDEQLKALAGPPGENEAETGMLIIVIDGKPVVRTVVLDNNGQICRGIAIGTYNDGSPKSFFDISDHMEHMTHEDVMEIMNDGLDHSKELMGKKELKQLK